MSTPEIRFSTEASTMGYVTLVSSLVFGIAFWLLGSFAGGMRPWSGALLGALIGLGHLRQTIILDGGALHLRMGLLTRRTYPLDRGAFRVEKMSGFKALLCTMHTTGYVLYISEPGKRDRFLGLCLYPKESEILLGCLNERVPLQGWEGKRKGDSPSEDTA